MTRMFSLLLLVALAACALSSSPILAHGASRGLHLHLTPDPCRAGEKLDVKIDASKPLSVLRIGLTEQEPLEIRPKKPSKTLRATLTVPDDITADSLNVQAEAIAEDGTVLRAAAVVIIAKGNDSR